MIVVDTDVLIDSLKWGKTLIRPRFSGDSEREACHYHDHCIRVVQRGKNWTGARLDREVAVGP